MLMVLIINLYSYIYDACTYFHFALILCLLDRELIPNEDLHLDTYL